MSETSATSGTGQDRATRDYLAELSFHLLATGTSGQRTGEVLAEVEAHVHATGEPAREAFGPPREYARHWAPDVPPQVRRRRRLRSLVGFGLYAAVAAVLGWHVGQGVRNGGLPIVSSDLAAGGLLLTLMSAIGLAVLVHPGPRSNRVIDPRTGRAWSGNRSALLGAALVLAVLLVTGLVLMVVY